MFLFQELLRIPNSRQTEATNILQGIQELMQPRKGFRKGIIARYLGNPTDFLVLRWWDSPGDWDEFRASPEGQYPSTLPEGLFQQLPVGRRWNMVIDSPGTAEGNYLVRSVYGVNDGRYDEFVANRERHDGLALQIPGTVGLWMYRCIDQSEETRDTFLCLAQRADREAYNAYLESPQAKEYRSGNPRGMYKTISTECFEVIRETNRK